MLLKEVDDKRPAIDQLKSLLECAPQKLKEKIRKDLNIVQSGLQGEAQAAYLIDFDLKDSPRTAVIHDLRLEINGRVAQIDHLLIHRTLNIYVLETKHVSAGLKIDDDGQFLRWNAYKRCYEGMASPLAQNERHIAVLKDVFAQIDMPTRLGLRLFPTFHSLVVVNPDARIDRPKKFDTTKVIKADQLLKAIDRTMENESTLDGLASIARLISTETLETIGRQLVTLHRPAAFDFIWKYNLSDSNVDSQKLISIKSPSASARLRDDAPTTARAEMMSVAWGNQFVCRHCQQTTLSIQYGKFGYYFKCSACDGNTPIRLDCGHPRHKEKLRKDGKKYFRECAECETSTLFFENI